MALATYSDLKAAIPTWPDRSDIAATAADFITLAEAELNRELPVVETDTTIAGTAGSASIDVSSLAVVAPLGLFYISGTGDETELTRQPPGSFDAISFSGQPSTWALDGTKIDFERALDAAYNFRFRYRQKFSLSDAAPTNWLLTNHPDVYLAASLKWAGIYVQDDGLASTNASILDAAMPGVKRILGLARRGTLTVDPALLTSWCS